MRGNNKKQKNKFWILTSSRLMSGLLRMTEQTADSNLKKQKNKFWILTSSFGLLRMTIVGIFLLVIIVFPHTVLAQGPGNLGLEGVSEASGLAGGNISIIVARIIRAFMGLLGILAVGLIIYAGYIWMTAGGEEEKVTHAKKILLQATIGLGIILSAFAIASFVINALTKAISGPTGFNVSTDGAGGFGGGGFGSSSEMAVKMPASTKAGFVTEFNVYFFKGFGTPITPKLSTIIQGSTLTLTQNGAAVPVDIVGVANMVSLRAKQTCPQNKKNKPFCFGNNGEYVLSLKDGFGGINAEDGTPLACTSGNPCTATIKTGNIDDSTLPTGALSYLKQIGGIGGNIYPGGGAPINSNYTLNGEAKDDLEVQHVILYRDSVLFAAIPASIGADGFYPVVQTIAHPWSTQGEIIFSNHTIGIDVVDSSGNSNRGNGISYISIGASCLNGKQDSPQSTPPSDETGIDCGGSQCLQCTGKSCTQNDQCASGKCVSGVCVQDPIITGVFENNGAPNNLITIVGKGFGNFNQSGTVKIADMIAPLPTTTQNPLCNTFVWTDTQIIVHVPNAAGLTGPITVTRKDLKSDHTNDSNGPQIPDFEINDIVRPGLYCVLPIIGYAGTPMMLFGNNFGQMTPQSFVQVGQIPVMSVMWNTTQIISSIPSITAGVQPVKAKTNEGTSNTFFIKVLEITNSAKPAIVSLTPATGGPGTTVTILGNGFGDKKGTVFFGTTPADTAFPAQCGTNFWDPTKILVKVPAGIALGAVAVTVERVEPILKSTGVNFNVTGALPGPGICKLSPDNGPVSTKIKIIGDLFGSAAGDVFFNSSTNAKATVSEWKQSELLDVVVPQNAQTGNVIVKTAANAFSNGFPFLIKNCIESGCGDGMKCCVSGPDAGACRPQNEQCSVETGPPTAKFEWIFSTGKVPKIPELVYQCGTGLSPSPAPWDGRNGGKNVCVNAKVSVMFSVPVNTLKFGDHVILEECIGTAQNACSTATKVNATLTMIEGGKGASIAPDALLKPKTLYRVTLGTSITSVEKTEDGKIIPMVKNSGCIKPVGFLDDASACFSFVTQGASELCAVKNVLVAPSDWVTNTFGMVKESLSSQNNLTYMASGIGDDQCVLLNTDNGPWNWSLAHDPNPPQSVALKDLVIPKMHLRNAEAFKEHPPNTKISILGEYTNPNDVKVWGASTLGVYLANPKVVSSYPNCNKACANAGIGALFTTKMNVESMFSDKVVLAECFDETCAKLNNAKVIKQISELAPNTNGQFEYQYIFKNYDGSALLILPAGKWFRVLIGGGPSGVKSTSGAKLDGLNYGITYSWTFRTRDAADACVVEKVSIAPLVASVSTIGSIASYTALPKSKPDACDSNGQKLNASSYSWQWTTELPAVAIITNKDFGVGPAYCTNTCTLSGSSFVPAACGDGIIQSKFEECDGGALCTSQCLRTGTKPKVQGGTCGNADKSSGSYKSAIVNPWIEVGEDCDDGNIVANDGCSDICLNEGSVKAGSLCGNGDLGPGEDCDDGNTIAGDGCNGQCLKEGSPKYDPQCANLTPFSPQSLKTACEGNVFFAMCGNKLIETGESCDDGNLISNDGCSTNCLKENAPAPKSLALCGNGNVEAANGEQCDPQKQTDGKVDPVQTATAVGDGVVLDGAQTTKVFAQVSKNIDGTAIVNGASGEAQFALQCGFVSEAECAQATGDGALYGVAKNSCCSLRPKIKEVYPAYPSFNICPNTSVWLELDKEIDPNTLTGNAGIFVFHSLEGSGTCPGSGVKPEYIVTKNTPETNKGIFERFINTIIAFFKGDEVKATGYHCPAPIKGEFLVQTIIETETVGEETQKKKHSRIVFKQKELFKASDNGYFVAIKGGEKGVRGMDGVSMKDGWNIATFFTAKNEICELDALGLSDNHLLFTKPKEQDVLLAVAVTKEGAEISSIKDVYAWDMQWAHSGAEPSDVIQYPKTDMDVAPEAVPQSKENEQYLRANGKTGQTTVTAIATISSDITKKSLGKQFSDSAEVEVFICENPWPSFDVNDATFEDSEKAKLALSNIADISGGLAQPKYTNFGTRYCRDQSKKDDTSDDLPKLQPVVIGNPPNPDTTIKEFFFYPTNDAGEKANKDAIGIRVERNPTHAPIAQWYKERGYTGAPQSTTVDGFPAINDGRTMYISGFNANFSHDLAYELYTNVYVISYNQSASPSTLHIYNQLLSNFKLMVNSVGSKLCYAETDTIFSTTMNQKDNTEIILNSGNPLACITDVACSGLVAPAGTKARCDALKNKAQRDLLRIADAETMHKKLNEHYQKNNAYPLLQSGTFIPGMTLSAWSSWQGNLGNALGAALPLDPLNGLETCADVAADKKTCWNEALGTFQCTKGSQVYGYKMKNGGQNYELSMNLELSKDLWKANSIFDIGETQYCEVAESSISASSEAICGNKVIEINAGEECDPPGSAFFSSTIQGDIETIQKFTCSLSCKMEQGGSVLQKSCGNGTLEGSENCDDGAKNGTYGYCNIACAATVKCGDGILQTKDTTQKGPEVCEIKRCENAKDVVCSENSACTNVSINLKSDPRFSGCIVKTIPILNSEYLDCGTCKVFGTIYAKEQANSCNWDCRQFGPYCGDGVKNGVEQCDGNVTEQCVLTNGNIGVKNGTCNADCNWQIDIQNAICNPPPAIDTVTAATIEGCGDGKIEAAKGEQCDLGTQNGLLCYAEYGKTCTYCSAKKGFETGCALKTLSGGYCGDGTAQSLEECDKLDLKETAISICNKYGYDFGTPQCSNLCTNTQTGCEYCGQRSSSGTRITNLVGFVKNAINNEGIEDISVRVNYKGGQPKLPLSEIKTGASGVFSGLYLANASVCTEYSLIYHNFAVSGIGGYTQDFTPRFSALNYVAKAANAGFLFPASEEEESDNEMNKLELDEYGVVVYHPNKDDKINLRVKMMTNSGIKYINQITTSNGSCPLPAKRCVYKEQNKNLMGIFYVNDSVPDTSFESLVIKDPNLKEGYNTSKTTKFDYTIEISDQKYDGKFNNGTMPLLIKIVKGDWTSTQKLLRFPEDAQKPQDVSLDNVITIKLKTINNGNDLDITNAIME